MDLSAERYIRTPGIRVRHTSETVSTNTDIMQLAADGEAEGLLLIAERQTAGRGRRGRSFYSPDGGLYMSMLLRPVSAAEDVMLLTPMAAVAVAEAVDALCGTDTRIKWVNDILSNDKKICGILTEAVFGERSVPEAVALGIGLNLIAPRDGFPCEICDIAGAVFLDACPDETLPARLIAEIWDRFFAYYREPALLAFRETYRKKQALTGKEVSVIRSGETRNAVVLGVDERCGLIVRYPDGFEETLTSGEVSVRKNP